jgi:type II secretory pathway pseudopilin PulG
MNKLKNYAGVTLIEMLIGIVISVIIMAAMFASYSAINNSYSQVTDKAKASQSGRNILAIIMRDIRQAGFKYFEDNIENTDEPIRITPVQGGVDANIDSTCDHIRIVYGDVSYDGNDDEVYERYRVTYFCRDSEITGPDGNNIQTNAIYKKKEVLAEDGTWVDNVAGSYDEQLLTDYVEGLRFIPKNINGVAIDPPPRNDNVNRLRIYDIRAVEILLTTRSVKDFYKTTTQADGSTRVIVDFENNIEEVTDDLFLRETFVMSANTRNVGLK